MICSKICQIFWDDFFLLLFFGPCGQNYTIKFNHIFAKKAYILGQFGKKKYGFFYHYNIGVLFTNVWRSLFVVFDQNVTFFFPLFGLIILAVWKPTTSLNPRFEPPKPITCINPRLGPH